MDKNDAIMAGEDELVRDEDRVPDDDAGEDVEGTPDTFEVELDGQVHTLPAALKGAFLRQADYTRKTQELAEHRRALEAERQAVAEHRRGLDDEAGDRATLAALDRHLGEFEGVDWQGLNLADPRRAEALWASFQESQALRGRFAYALAHHEQRAEPQAARRAAEEMAATGQQLRQEIEGWSPEVASKLVEYAQAFGVTNEELAQMADPRLWKLLHKAWRADQAGQGEPGEPAREIRPAVTVGGGAVGGGGVRDELGTKEWMRRRNAQMTGGR